VKKNQKMKKKSLCLQGTVFYFVKAPSGTLTFPPVLLDNGDDDPDDLPAVQEEIPLR
jgi:hypothetical protein